MKIHEKSSFFKKNVIFRKYGRNLENGLKTVILWSITREKRTKTPKKRTFGPENELAIFEKKKKLSTTPQTGLP